jgi:hypothetical protein
MASRVWRRTTARRLLLIVLLLAVSVEVTPAAAAAAQTLSRVRYLDAGRDPNDVPVDRTSCCQQDPDIAYTTRKVWVDRHRRAWLNVSFATHDPLDDYWSVAVRLDTRGGPRYDARIVIFDDGASEDCRFRRRGMTARDARHRIIDVDRVQCRVPLRWIEPRKRIRWRLFSAGGGEGTGPAIDEYAPDMGWYS